MYDKEAVLDILKQIHDAIHRIIRRSEAITKIEDFTDSPEGQEKLDSICILLVPLMTPTSSTPRFCRRFFS